MSFNWHNDSKSLGNKEWIDDGWWSNLVWKATYSTENTYALLKSSGQGGQRGVHLFWKVFLWGVRKDSTCQWCGNRNPPPSPDQSAGNGVAFVMGVKFSIHITEQLLAFSFLKVEERSSDLLGRCSRRLDSRRVGLGLASGCSLLMQARAAVRNTLWMLFSEVKAEHSR